MCAFKEIFKGSLTELRNVVEKVSRVLCKPCMAVVAVRVFFALLFVEVEAEVEVDTWVSLRELNPRFEDEGVDTTGSGAGVWVASCVPR
jgi:hypothetical protein